MRQLNKVIRHIERWTCIQKVCISIVMTGSSPDDWIY
jgi:hypothetical protein